MKTRECDVGGAVRLPKQFYERPLTLEESRLLRNTLVLCTAI